MNDEKQNKTSLSLCLLTKPDFAYFLFSNSNQLWTTWKSSGLLSPAQRIYHSWRNLQTKQFHQIVTFVFVLFSCMQCRHFNFYVSTFSRQKQQKQKQKQKKTEIVMTITFVELGTWYHCQFFILAKKREKTKRSKVLNKKNKSRELRLKYSFSFSSFSPFLVRFPI